MPTCSSSSGAVGPWDAGSSSGAILGAVISPEGAKSLRGIVDSFHLCVGLTHNGDSLHLAPPRLLVDRIYCACSGLLNRFLRICIC